MDEQHRRNLPRTGYPRRRAVAACLTCRERKRKCDNLRPACSSCIRIGAACLYTKQDDSAFDAASLKILDQLSIIEGLLRDINVTPTTDWSSLRTGVDGLLQARNTRAFPQQENSHPISQFTPRTNSDGGLDALTDKLLQWPIFGELLSPLQRFTYTDFRGAEIETYLDDLFNPPNFVPNSSIFEDERQYSSSLNISTEKSDIEKLVDQFFTRVNIKNPIISRTEIDHYCQRYYEYGPLSDLETCLVMLTCALGAISMVFDSHGDRQEPQTPPQPSARQFSLHLGCTYFVAAEHRLGIALSNNNTLSIQCLCLAGIFHMYSINPVAALRFFRAAASPLQMTVSTNSAGIEGLTQLNSSLFWMCYKSEREILAEIPISDPILKHCQSLNSYPPPPPRTASFRNEEHKAASEEASWYFFLSEIALRRITDQVSEIASGYIKTMLQDEGAVTNIEELIPIVAELEHQAEAFRQQLPAAISFPDVPQICSSEWKQYSRGRYYRVLDLMHRPFLFVIVHDPSTANNTVVRDLAEKCLLNGLRYLQHSHASHRHHGLWLQLRNELKAASLLIAASKSVAVQLGRLRLPNGWEEAVTKTLSTFNYWSVEYPPCKTYANVLLTMARSSPLASATQRSETSRCVGVEETS